MSKDLFEKKTKAIQEVFEQEFFGKFERPARESWKLIGAVIVLAFIFGLTGGGLGFWLGQKFWGGGGPRLKVIEKTEKIILSPEEGIKEVILKVKNRAVGIFEERTGTAVLTGSAAPVGNGLILTSDGWILTADKVVRPEKKYEIVTGRGEVFKLKKILSDSETGLVFGKIEASDLEPVEFKDGSVGQGDKIFGWNFGAPGQVFVSLIKNWDKPAIKTGDLIHSSEERARYFNLQDKIESDWEGMGLFDWGGKLAGINRGGKMIGTAGIAKILEGILATGKIKKPSLGVFYLDLSEVLVGRQTEWPAQGALIWDWEKIVTISGKKDGKKTEKIAGVKEGGAAEAAGLKSGDIILKVENESVSALRSLTDLIADYQPGQEIELLVIREQKEQKIKVILGF